jgi:hypothetical protein
MVSRLGLAFLQDGDVGVSAFPEGEKVWIRRSCVGGVLSHRVRAPRPLGASFGFWRS